MSLKIGMVSLGCPKNLVDSENMLGILKHDGFEITNDPADSDVIIVNTCGFIGDAKEESINTILEMSGYKKNGKCKYLVVTGCLAERYSEEIRNEIPEADIILGTAKFPEIAEYIKSAEKGAKIVRTGDIDRVFEDDLMPRVQTTQSCTAYIKISDGCDKFCTYCIIPKLRGKYRSRSIESIVKEAEGLVQNGVKEIILIAQDTSSYGIDLYNRFALHELLNELGKIEKLEWIRFLYTYPENITDELIYEIKTNKKICRYIDMPIQHASNNVLKRMGRHDTKQDILNIINKIKVDIPDIILRTSLIVGFPGETESDFNELTNFVEQVKFNKLGVFMYSEEEGTPAADFDDQIDENIKIQRYNKIMEIQQEISYNNNKQYINKEYKAIVTGKDINSNLYYGRTYMDVPNIDGIAYVQAPNGNYNIGDFINFKVKSVSKYDILGEIVK